MDEMDLLDQKVIMQILSESDKSEDRDRRRNSFNAYQVYAGNQKVYVERQLARTRPTSWSSYTISNISVSKMITDKRAQAYNEQPIRSVNGSEEKTELLSEIYEDANADRELQFHDVVFNLNKYDLIWVNYLEEKEKYQIMCLHPYEFILVRDQDTGEVLIVGLSYPDTNITQGARGTGVDGNSTSGDGTSDIIAESQTDSGADSETWVFWSKDQHVKVRRSDKVVIVDGAEQIKPNIDYIPIDNNPSNVNPLGVLPFVLTQFDTAVDYPIVNPLTEQSIAFNVQQSETLTSKNIHGTGIQTFKFPERMMDRFKRNSHGQTEAILLPQSSKDGDPATDFEYKTSGAQLGPMMDSDMNLLRQILQEHGVDGVKMDLADSNATSGISRAIASSSVQKVIELNQQIYTDTEKKIFEVIKAWEEFNGTRRFSKDDTLQVVFQKPKVMISDKETLDNIKLQLELGILEEWEKYIKMDPNLSEQEAKEKLARVEKNREDKAQKMLSRGLSANQQIGVDKESSIEPKGFGAKPEEKS